MDWLIQQLDTLVSFIGDETRQGALALIGGTIAAVSVAIWYVWNSRRKEAGGSKLHLPEPAKPSVLNSAGAITLTIEEYDRRLRDRENELSKQVLETAGSQRKALIAQKAELQARLSNIEPAYHDTLEKIRELEEALSRAGQDVSGERLSAAVAALEKGDSTLAEKIFFEVLQDQEPALKRASQAAYGRGLIAEERVDWLEAARQFQKSVSLCKSEPGLYKANVYLWKAGLYHPAIGASLELLDLIKARCGEQSSDFAGAVNNLAAQMYDARNTEEAIAQFNRSLEIKRALKEDNTMDYAASLANLANVYILEKKFNSAERLHRQATEIAEKVVGRKDERFVSMLNGLAEVLRILGKFQESEKYFLEVVDTDLELFGSDHPVRARDLHFYSKLLGKMERYDEAKSLLYQAIDISRRRLGEHHPNTFHVADYLAWILKKSGEGEKDSKMLTELQEIFGDEIGLHDEET